MQYNPLFRSVVRCHLDQPRFLRRDWLADEVSKAVGAPECRFVLIVGEPGSGKSTFIAQSASDDPTAPVYFIRHDQRTPLGDVGARSFLLQIGYQLAAVHPELFNPEQIEIVVRQRVGEVHSSGEVVGAEVGVCSGYVQKPVIRRLLKVYMQEKPHSIAFSGKALSPSRLS